MSYIERPCHCDRKLNLLPPLPKPKVLQRTPTPHNIHIRRCEPKTSNGGSHTKCCCGCSCPYCKAGVCRCWYCGIWWTPLFYLITLAIIGVACYYAISYCLEDEQHWIPHVINLSLVAAAIFTLVVIQLVYILVYYENKFKCGAVIFGFFFFLAFVLCVTVVVFIALTFNSPPSEGGEPPGQNGPFGRGGDELRRRKRDADDDEVEITTKETGDGGTGVGGSGDGGTGAGGTGDGGTGDGGTGTSGTGAGGTGDGVTGASGTGGSGTGVAGTSTDGPGTGTGGGFDDFENHDDSLKPGMKFTPKILKAILAGVLVLLLIFCFHIYLYYCLRFCGDEEVVKCMSGDLSAGDGSALSVGSSMSSKCRELLGDRGYNYSNRGSSSAKKKSPKGTAVFYFHGYAI